MTSKTRQTIDTYYAVFQRFPSGVEAMVHPTETSRDIAKLLKSGEFKNVVCIHKIEAGCVSDVTAEFVEETRLDLMDEAADAAQWLEEMA